MAQYTDIMNVNLPVGYQFRYTLDYYLRLYAASQGMEIRDVIAEILSLLEEAGVGMKERMLYYYRNEQIDGSREPMSLERLEVLADYFEVKPDHLITENITPTE